MATLCLHASHSSRVTSNFVALTGPTSNHDSLLISMTAHYCPGNYTKCGSLCKQASFPRRVSHRDQLPKWLPSTSALQRRHLAAHVWRSGEGQSGGPGNLHCGGDATGEETHSHFLSLQISIQNLLLDFAHFFCGPLASTYFIMCSVTICLCLFVSLCTFVKPTSRLSVCVRTMNSLPEMISATPISCELETMESSCWPFSVSPSRVYIF